MVLGRLGKHVGIRKTCPCNVYPLEPHFCIAKLGYVGVYLFLAHLSRRLTGELIGKAGIRRPSSSVVRPSTISKKNISEASRPILIKFNVSHNWVGGLMALGFGADCIKIVVSMATDRSHRLTMGKTKKIFFSETTRPTALIFGM